MKSAVFTICTLDHLSNGLTAIDSVYRNTSNNYIDYYVFILDINNKIKNNTIIDNIRLVDLKDNLKNDLYKKYYNIIINKYGFISNETRWICKSLISYYLTTLYNKTIYIDTDILFVNNIDFLFNMINKNILLTPHHRKIDPPNFHKCNLTDGYFNAGFFGTSNHEECRKVILWWLENCIVNCKKQPIYGLYDDQKYLDLMFIHFNDIVKKTIHKGCNIAEWNIDNYNINTLDTSELFIIDNQYYPIFFHLSSYNNNKNKILNKYYNKYQQYNQYFKRKIINNNLI